MEYDSDSDIVSDSNSFKEAAKLSTNAYNGMVF